MSNLEYMAPMLLMAGAAMLLLPRIDPDNRWARGIGAAVTILFLLRYMAWRLTETLPPLEASFSSVVAYAFCAVEMASCLAGLILLHVLSRTCNRSAEVDAQLARGFGDDPPLIDIFIPTYNEKAEILRRTIIGAMQQDYPRFRVWVLDDGKRAWLEEMSRELGAGYLTRRDNKHGKAGNMNAGLANVLAMPEVPDVIAVLDADFVPTPKFLSRGVSLFHDPRVALVQTPQYFFNPDPIQLNLGAAKIVPDEQRFFFDVILASKDAHGTAFSCGTSSLVRVDALQAVGGFPTESVTEDLLVSIKLSGKGWRTAYLNEPLSVGLAPEGLGEYLTQRGRWCLGTMQIVRTPWGPFSRGSTPWLMRLHTLDTVLFWTAGSVIRILSLLIPILYWWFGLVVMKTDLPAILSHLGPYWLCCVTFLGWVSRGTNLPVLTEAMSLLTSVEAMKASAIGLFGSRDQKFKVTAKGTSRDKVVVQWPLVRWYLLLAGLTIGGVGWRVLQGPFEGTPPDIELMNLFWSFYNVVTLMLACLMCVELPRMRAEERFETDEAARVRLEEGTMPARLLDISITGARMEGHQLQELAPGTPVEVEIRDVGWVRATVTRWTGSAISVSFGADNAQSGAIIRKIFSGRYAQTVTRMGTGPFVQAVAARAFGRA
ncbi:glycosyltransferase [Roseomonas chloroacetimidivorans]|uniref:glycosyltransferase n=1 Tax=Roseomonas chloroacetimidivorans TaxID=1766656 RepID=UPI003C72CF1A